MVVEPMALLESLEIARVVGEEKIILDELSVMRRLAPEDNSEFDRMISLLSPLPAVGKPNVVLLSQQQIEMLTHELKYNYAGRVTSLLVGPLDQVAKHSDDYQGRDHFQATAQKALDHGYFPIALARRIDAKLEGGKKRFKIEGLVVCEPIISDKKRRQLRSIVGPNKFKFVSVLPTGVASSLLQSVFPVDGVISVASASNLKLLSPKDRQSKLDQAMVLGEMTLDDSYQAALYFEHRWETVSVGMSPKTAHHLPGKDLTL